MQLILPIATAQHVAIVLWCVCLCGKRKREKALNEQVKNKRILIRSTYKCTYTIIYGFERKNESLTN